MEINNNKYYSTSQAANYLHISQKSVRRRILLGYVNAINRNKKGVCPRYFIKGEELKKTKEIMEEDALL